MFTTIIQIILTLLFAFLVPILSAMVINYLVLNSLGLSNVVFLLVTGAINWVLLIGFIWLVYRATITSTRHAQAPAIRATALRRAAAQLPEHVEAA